MTAASLVLGIDLGTTGIKALVLDTISGRTLTSAYRTYPSSTGDDGRHEQDPEQWWTACAQVTRDALGAIAPQRVAAVGLSGHMHGVVLVDENDDPVRPAMTWADRRCVAQVTKLRAIGDQFLARCANPVVEAFTAPKLAWLIDHEPDSVNRASRVVQAKDFLRHRLTATWGTDTTDARGTLLYDVRRNTWDPDLWASCGASQALSPQVSGSSSVVGSVTGPAAAITGLAAGTPVVAGAGDVACAALGAGLVEEGVIYLNVGTAAQVSTVLPSAVPGSHFVFGRADSEGFLGMASVYAAGLSVDWASRTLLDATETTTPPGQQLTELAKTEPAGARGVTFVPHLLGTSVPTHDPDVRGSLFGLGVDTDKKTLARAVLEGVAYACVQAVRAVAELGGGAHRVHLGGGLSRSAVWRDAVSATLDTPAARIGEDASARGAAMLAALGAGLWSSATEAAQACVTAEELPTPSLGAETAHRLAFRRYEMAAAMQLQWTRRMTEPEHPEEST